MTCIDIKILNQYKINIFFRFWQVLQSRVGLKCLNALKLFPKIFLLIFTNERIYLSKAKIIISFLFIQNNCLMKIHTNKQNNYKSVRQVCTDSTWVETIMIQGETNTNFQSPNSLFQKYRNRNLITTDLGIHHSVTILKKNGYVIVERHWQTVAMERMFYIPQMKQNVTCLSLAKLFLA